MKIKNITNESMVPEESAEALPETPNPLKNRAGFKNTGLLIMAILVIGGVFGSWYFYGKYQELKANPNVEAQKQTASFVSKVGKLMELPANETPTVATISDKEKLKGQLFFKTAENGDVLLAYTTTSMQAILYRPSTDKIINVAPISLNQAENLAQGTTLGASTAAPLRVVYYNGTKTVGLSAVAEKTVKNKYPNYQTAALASASQKNYTTTLVVDLSGKHSQESNELASLLGGQVSSLPQGETAPNADILIIAGK